MSRGAAAAAVALARAAKRRLPGGRAGRIAAYGSTRALGDALIGLRGVLLAGMLGPEAFGVWALFRLVLTYASFAGLGLLRGLELEVARAPGDAGAREAWGRTAAGCAIGLFGLASLGALAAAGAAGAPWLRQLLGAIAAGLLLERLWFHGLYYLRAAGSLRDYALHELAQAVAQVVLTLGLAARWGLGGAFAGFALANLLALALIRGRAPFRPSLDLGRLRTMLAVGVPLTATQLLGALLASVDRVVLGATLGIAALGQYAFAASVASLGLSAALVVRTVVFPDVYGRSGRDDPAEVADGLIEGTIRPFVLLLALLVGLGTLAIGPVAAAALPRYLAAAEPAAVFVFTGVAQGAVNLAMLGVVVAGRQALVAGFALGAVLANAGLAWASLHLGLGMVGLAAGAVIGRLAYAFGVLTLLARGTARRPAWVAASVLWPVAWCAAVNAAVVLTVAPRDLAGLAAAGSAYAAGTAPVLLALARHVAGTRRRRRPCLSAPAGGTPAPESRPVGPPR